MSLCTMTDFEAKSYLSHRPITHTSNQSEPLYTTLEAEYVPSSYRYHGTIFLSPQCLMLDD